jgi:hypothetical protein
VLMASANSGNVWAATPLPRFFESHEGSSRAIEKLCDERIDPLRNAGVRQCRTDKAARALKFYVFGQGTEAARASASRAASAMALWRGSVASKCGIGRLNMTLSKSLAPHCPRD